MRVSLEPVTSSNWLECAELGIAPHQAGLVASNIKSLAEWHFNPHYIGRAIYRDDQMVGFVMYCPGIDAGEDNLFWIFRFMISESFQNQKIGFAALSLIIAEIWTFGRNAINIIYSPRNNVASHLYSKLGFVSIGTLNDGDIVAQLQRKTAQHKKECR